MTVKGGSAHQGFVLQGVSLTCDEYESSSYGWNICLVGIWFFDALYLWTHLLLVYYIHLGLKIDVYFILTF